MNIRLNDKKNNSKDSIFSQSFSIGGRDTERTFNKSKMIKKMKEKVPFFVKNNSHTNFQK